MARKGFRRKKIPRAIFDKDTTRQIRSALKEKVELNQSRIRQRQKAGIDRIVKQIKQEEDVTVDRNRVRPIRIIIGKVKGETQERFISKGIRKSGKFKGKEVFRDRDSRKIVSVTFVRQSIASRKYWAHVKWIREVLGISNKQARTLLKQARVKASLMTSLQRAGLVTTSGPEQKKQ